MAEPLPEALGWLDAKKQAVISSLANLLADPQGTLGGWTQRLAQGARDFGQPVQSIQSVMPDVREAGLQRMAAMAPGLLAGTVHRFPVEAARPSIEGYSVTELPHSVSSFPLNKALQNSTWDQKSNLAEANWMLSLMEPVIKAGNLTTEQINTYNKYLQLKKAAEEALAPK